MVVERAARPRNEVATGVSRPGEPNACRHTVTVVTIRARAAGFVQFRWVRNNRASDQHILRDPLHFPARKVIVRYRKIAAGNLA